MSEPDRVEPIDAFLKRSLGGGSDEIQPNREDRLLREDPKLAAEVARRLAALPSPDGVYAPISLGMPESLCPEAYVMHNHTTRCTTCNTEHRYSEVFALHILKGRSGMGLVRNMRPVTKLEWNVPLQVHNMTTKLVCGCFECFDAIKAEILPTLRSRPVPEAPVKLSPVTEGDTASEGRTTGSGPKQPKSKPSADDFLV